MTDAATFGAPDDRESSPLLDAAIIADFRGDDVDAADAAFTQVFRRYYVLLVRAALCQYVEQRADAEEVVQNLFERLWRDRRKLPDDVPFERCLRTRLRSDALNFLARRRGILLLTDDAPADVAADHDLVEEIVRRSLVGQVWEAVQRILPERCAQAFHLKYREEKSDQEIAEAMQLTIGTVEQHLVNGRKRVREHMSAKVM